MKYLFAILFLNINLIMQGAPKYSYTARMGEKNDAIIHHPIELHKNQMIPSCSDIIGCLKCCCHAILVIGALALSSPSPTQTKNSGTNREDISP